MENVDVIAGEKDSMNPDRKVQVNNNYGRAWSHPRRYRHDVALFKNLKTLFSRLQLEPRSFFTVLCGKNTQRRWRRLHDAGLGGKPR